MIDLKEVLALCEKVPPEPWKYEREEQDTGAQSGLKLIFETVVDADGIRLLRLNDKPLAQFIALARTALPEIAQRVIELEAERETLMAGLLKNSNVVVNRPPIPESEMIEHLQGQIAVLWRELADSQQRTNDVYRGVYKLEDENARLRAVAIAAEESLALLNSKMVSFDNGVEVYGVGNEGDYLARQVINSLREALANAGYGGEE